MDLDLVPVGARWLHLVATVTMIGFYAVLGLLVLPVLTRVVTARQLGDTIAAVERRALPVIIGSLAIFLATGVYLMGADARYGGVGDVTGSAWATLLLAKHLVVAVMVGLGVYIDAIIARRMAPPEETDQVAAARRLTVVAGAMTVLGAVVLFLTAAAQAS
jgi:uncharacterized membrane protein